LAASRRAFFIKTCHNAVGRQTVWESDDHIPFLEGEARNASAQFLRRLILDPLSTEAANAGRPPVSTALRRSAARVEALGKLKDE